MRDEVLGADASVRAGIARQEENRVIRLRRVGRRLRGRVRARQLEQCGRAGAVVVGTWARARVVAVRDDDDQLVRAALARRDQVFELDVSATWDFRVKTLAT